MLAHTHLQRSRTNYKLRKKLPQTMQNRCQDSSTNNMSIIKTITSLNLSTKIAIATLLLSFLAILAPNTAHAALPNFIVNNRGGIPTAMTTGPGGGGAHPGVENIVDCNFNYAQYQWVSQTPDSALRTLNVPYGTTDVILKYNVLAAVCNNNIEANGNIIAKDKDRTKYNVVSASAHLAGDTSKTFGIAGLVGTGPEVTHTSCYSSPNCRYFKESRNGWPVHQPFFVSGLGGLGVGDHTITVKIQNRTITKGLGNTWACVKLLPANPPTWPHGEIQDADSLTDSRCGTFDVQFDIIIHVDPPEDLRPKGEPETTCSGIRVFNAQDDNVPNRAVQFDIYRDPVSAGFVVGDTADATTNDKFVNMRGVVPPGTKLLIGFYNYNYLNVNDNSGLKVHWVTHTWSPDPNCPPPYNITATPTVSMLPDDENPTSFTPTVEFTANFPWGTKYKLADVDLTCNFYILKADGTKPLDEDDDKPNTVFDAPTHKNSCTKAGGFTPLASYNLKAGDQVCIRYTANPGSGNIELPSGAQISPDPALPLTTYCKPVTNKPYVSVFGGDVIAGGGFGTASCTQDTTAFIKGSLRSAGIGSGVQLAAMALNTSIFNTKSMQTATTDSLWFANTGAGIPGKFGTVPCTHDYLSEAPAVSTPALRGTIPAATITALTNGKHTVDTTTPPLAVTTLDEALTIGVGRKLELYVKGDLYIKKNISLAAGATSRGDLPFFKIVVKGNIYIHKDVDQLDGIFVAQPAGANRGVIYTCADNAGAIGLSSLFAECGKQLTVNGAFIAKRVQLMRTLGSLRDAGAAQSPYAGSNNCSSSAGTVARPICSGEVFKYSPQTFLGINEVSSGSDGGDENSFITTLPPIL